jgi:hypothetical protein
VKLPERLARRSGRAFHSAVATTFAIEFSAVEEILLPQLMASGASNLLLMADERMVAMALSNGSALPTALGRDYALHSPPASDGIFHPKIILQLGRDAGRAFVSSANATGAGLAGNAEVAIEIECTGEESPEREIIRSIWRYLNGLVSAEPSPARDALRWARERAHWLEGPPGASLQDRDDGSGIAFLHAPEDQGIADQFVALVGGAKVRRLVVISPYWDSGLAALADLARRLAPRQIILPIDTEQHEFPVGARFAKTPRIVDLRWPSPRFTHAKIVVAMTAKHDHVLFGSANCTTAALGRPGGVGSNAEACIYRRLPRGAATLALGLDRWIDADPIVLTDLLPREVTSQIPLQALEAARPGIFEIDQGLLFWRPPAAQLVDGDVQVLDRTGSLISSIPVESFERNEGLRATSLEVSIQAKISFARLARGGSTSTLAHVSHRQTLRERRREVATGGVARALVPFTDGSDFDLWMHEAFETLVRADFAEDKPTGLTAGRSRQREEEAPAAQPLTLTYEEFTETRTGAERLSGPSANSLAGTYSDSVRAFLNLLSGRAEPSVSAVADDDSWMNVDEESGEQSDGPTVDASAEKPPQADATEAAPVDARLCQRYVLAYAEGLEDDEESLGSSDVLRLRFWLLFLLYKARCADLPKGLEGTSNPLSWPRFVVRILVSFFCGRSPAITRLVVASGYAGMPVDFMECWVTALWSLDAIEALLPNTPGNRQFLKYIPELRRRVIALLGLTPAELSGEMATEVRDGLDRTIGQRLGLALPVFLP